MDTPYLFQILALIKSHSKYSTDQALAKRLNMSARNLVGYWKEREPAGVPTDRIENFRDLFAEIIRPKMTRDETIRLITGTSHSFLAAICPIGGKEWAELVNELTGDLEIKKDPLAGLGFGEADYLEDEPASFEVAMYQKFFITGKLPWRGEYIIFCEQGGEWHAISHAPETRIVRPTGNQFVFPPKRNGKYHYLREKTKPGVYRYFAIAQRGKFSDGLRVHLQQANPFPQNALDAVASILNHEPNPTAVLGATLNVLIADNDGQGEH